MLIQSHRTDRSSFPERGKKKKRKILKRIFFAEKGVWPIELIKFIGCIRTFAMKDKKR